MNEMTKAGEYDRENPHLKRSSKKDEKELFRPNLASICEALLVVEPTGRLGTKEKGGYKELMAHPYFDGLNWNALNLGTLPPPIKPTHGKINADLPKELKDTFGEWAKKEVPADALATFADWTRTTAVAESYAVELVDENPVFFDGVDERMEFDRTPEDVKKKAFLKAGLWKETIKPPPAMGGAAKASGGGGATSGGGGGGGCCLVM
jgi:hypothetical protein